MLRKTPLLTAMLATLFSATAFADHQYGSPYSLGSSYSAEQRYHGQLDHNAFHRQQAHEQFHDTMNHQNYDRQLNGRGNGYLGSSYGSSFRSTPYYGGSSWNSYSMPTYRTPSYGGYPSSSYGNYSSGIGNNGYNNSWSPRW